MSLWNCFVAAHKAAIKQGRPHLKYKGKPNNAPKNPYAHPITHMHLADIRTPVPRTSFQEPHTTTVDIDTIANVMLWEHVMRDVNNSRSIHLLPQPQTPVTRPPPTTSHIDISCLYMVFIIHALQPRNAFDCKRWDNLLLNVSLQPY